MMPGGHGGPGGPLFRNRPPWRGGGDRGMPMRGGRGFGFERGMMPRFRGGARGFMPGPGPGPGPMGRGARFPPRGEPPRRPTWPHSDPPPHHMEREEEVDWWCETTAEDGKNYFYHPETREVSWERPTGPAVRILRHEEWVAKQATLRAQRPKLDHSSFPNSGPGPNGQGGPSHGQGPPQGHPMGGPPQGHPMTGPPGQPMTGPPGQPMSGPPGQPMMGGPPQGHPMTGPPGQPMTGPQGQPMGGPPQGHPMTGPPQGPPMTGPQGQPMGGPPMTGPPQGHPMGGPPMTGPPQGHPMSGPPGQPGPGPPMGGPDPSSAQLQNPNPPLGPPFENQFGPPFAPYGIPNMSFGTMPPWAFPGVPPPAGVPPPMADPILAQIDPKVTAAASEWTEHLAPDGKPYFFNIKAQTSTWERPQALVDFEKAKVEAEERLGSGGTGSGGTPAQTTPVERTKLVKKERKVEEKKSGEKVCRPVSSTPVAGTPWCVVWTGDRRVFFYNPSTKESVWDRPSELIGRQDVEELLTKVPDKVTEKATDKMAAKVKRVEATSTTSPLSEAPLESAPGTETDLEPPSKRARNGSGVWWLSNCLIVPVGVGFLVGEEKGKGGTGEQRRIERKDELKELTALEAEAKAARDRASIPPEVRLKDFRAMLREKAVSAFSTWEKELHKIVFDPRYLLLTSNERKKAFETFVTERAEEERREQKTRTQQTKDAFLQFLATIPNLHKLSYVDVSGKYGKDARFRSVDKSRDREAYFHEFLASQKRKEKEERALRKEKDREAFLHLLHEKVKESSWGYGEVRKRLEAESRWNAVEAEEREELFRLFQRRLRQENKKKEETERPVPNTEDISDIEDGVLTDQDSEEEERAEREKRERAALSIREREKEVQKSLASHLRDREKEREFYAHEEGVTQFNALLADLVRNPDLLWKEAKKILKKDRRWKGFEGLPRHEMEDLFLAHTEEMRRKKKQRFRELLQEQGVGYKTSWSDLKRRIKDDPRFTKFSSSERKCEREFEAYVKDMEASMKLDFRELLKETKLLNWKTLQVLKKTPSHMKEILSHLELDRRYLELKAPERQRLLEEYLEDLEAKGAPPPPTASEPSARRLKP